MINRSSLGYSDWSQFVYISNDVNKKQFMTSRHDVITYYGDKKYIRFILDVKTSVKQIKRNFQVPYTIHWRI